jgi:hypothetical protein
MKVDDDNEEHQRNLNENFGYLFVVYFASPRFRCYAVYSLYSFENIEVGLVVVGLFVMMYCCVLRIPMLKKRIPMARQWEMEYYYNYCHLIIDDLWADFEV